MRAIKFRAYYKPEKRMIYDIQNEFEGRIELGMNCFADYLNNDDFVVEQDTGLKDRNGKEIWEGDIVYCSVSNGFSWGTESFVSEVCIDETGVRFRQVSRRRFLEKRITQEIIDEILDIFEVMGNIHALSEEEK